MGFSDDPLKYGVISTLSPNRTGITAALTDFLFRNGANLLGSYAVKQGTTYSASLYFCARASAMQRIQEALVRDLAEFSPRFAESGPPEEATTPHAYELSIYAFDRAGIVKQTSELLGRTDVDIVAAAGCQYSAPEVAVPLYVVQMRVHARDEASVRRVSEDLERMADQNGWSLVFERADQKNASHTPASLPVPPRSAVAFGVRGLC